MASSNNPQHHRRHRARPQARELVDWPPRNTEAPPAQGPRLPARLRPESSRPERPFLLVQSHVPLQRTVAVPEPLTAITCASFWSAPLVNEASRRLTNLRRAVQNPSRQNQRLAEPIVRIHRANHRGRAGEGDGRSRHKSATPPQVCETSGLHQQPSPILRAGLATSNASSRAVTSHPDSWRTLPTTSAQSRSGQVWRFASIVPKSLVRTRKNPSIEHGHMVFREISSISHVRKSLAQARANLRDASPFNDL